MQKLCQRPLLLQQGHQSLNTKTATTAELKRTLLPIVVPIGGVSGLDWWAAFLAARKDFGLPEMPTLGKGAKSQRSFLLPSLMGGVATAP